MRAKIMLVNQHGASMRASVCASDAGRVNLQCLYTLAKVLQMFHQCCECIIKKQTVCILFYEHLSH